MNGAGGGGSYPGGQQPAGKPGAADITLTLQKMSELKVGSLKRKNNDNIILIHLYIYI